MVFDDTNNLAIQTSGVTKFYSDKAKSSTSLTSSSSSSGSSSSTTIVVNNKITPDQLLAEFGTKNIYLAWLWLAMGLNWGLSAMSMMISAFLMEENCKMDAFNCTKNNIATELKLTTNETYLLNYTASAFLFGVTVGSIILPPISDVKGRRLIIVGSMFGMGIFGCVSALSPGIYFFIVTRFLQGFFFTVPFYVIGCGIATWVLAYESISPRLRSYTALQFGLFWVLGYCIVSPMAYLIPNWRWLIVAVSLPMLLCAILYYFTIPESFHYLVIRGEVERVKSWIEKVNKFGNAKGCLTSEKVNQLFQSKTGTNKDNTERKNFLILVTILILVIFSLIQHLLNNRLLLIYTGILIYLWTCDAFIYYGLSLFSTRLAGNQYINFVLLGLIEIPSYLVSPFLLEKLGRKLFVSLCHFLAAASFIVVIFTHSAQINLWMWLVGKFAISCAFTSLFVYASEVFPTTVRNGCIGVCEVIARFGGSLVPLVQNMAAILPILPMIFFAICATIGGIITLLLPETARRELPDSTSEL